MTLKATIERISNGFIVRDSDSVEVFEDKNGNIDGDESGELATLQKALHCLKEKLGYFYCKHAKVNLVIKLTNQ